MNPSGSDVAFAFTPMLYKRTLRIPPWGDNFLCKASKIDNISHFNIRSKRGWEGRPPGVHILSISCSFWEIWQNCMFVPPPPRKLAPPPRGNPGSATSFVVSITFPMILSGRLQKSLGNLVLCHIMVQKTKIPKNSWNRKLI